MFPWGTAGLTVDWGGASPCSCLQYSRMSSKICAFQSCTTAGGGSWGTISPGCGVNWSAAVGTLLVAACWIKGGVAPWKNPRKRLGVGTASFSTEEDVEGCVEEGGPVAGGPPVNVEGPGKRIGSVDDSRGAGLRTCSAGTWGPRPDQVHGWGGGT